MARLMFSDFRAPAAAEAYDIALDHLWRTGAVRDEFETYQFLAVDGEVRHPEPVDWAAIYHPRNLCWSIALFK
jgi:hypothetical protein